MSDLILKIIIWSLLYGGGMLALGIYLGKTLSKVNPPERESLLEWPPYRDLGN
jgi:hypothetical protein